MPNTNEILLILKCFEYNESFDLNMVYYHIRIILKTFQYQ